MQRERRTRLFGLAGSMGLALAASGTHPWADYLDQRIIDTPHYRRLQNELGYVAQRNNTWSLHVHVGIRDVDRAIAVCDRMRELLPLLLAVSGNSPFLDRRDSGLASVRSQIFTRTFPRCGIPGRFGSWREYADFIETLKSTGSVVEPTQLWWSVRPHHAFGTVEVRICDAQTSGQESTALAGLIAACVAQSALDHDQLGHGGPGQGGPGPGGPGQGGPGGEPLRDREIEENLWRAIRYGMDGDLIDFRTGTVVEARRELERILAWTEPARSGLGIEVDLPEQNGAQRARAALQSGSSIEEIYAGIVARTEATYGGTGATAAAG